MPRYFIEVAYLGTNYSGFQIQDNANSIQAEVEKALHIYYKEEFKLTGSSRTDAGVHALSNYFHFDSPHPIDLKSVYNINALLPKDIVVQRIFEVHIDAHCRFDATFREYKYYISRYKNPFLINTAWHYPYNLNIEILNQTAATIKEHNNFESFSKKNTQVNNFFCRIDVSKWYYDEQTKCLVYHVIGNRFLRGMVKGLVSTMILVSRNKITLKQFEEILQSKDSSKANFSAPSKGLFLCSVGIDS